jgi:hypothetical protein
MNSIYTRHFGHCHRRSTSESADIPPPHDGGNPNTQTLFNLQFGQTLTGSRLGVVHCQWAKFSTLQPRPAATAPAGMLYPPVHAHSASMGTPNSLTGTAALCPTTKWPASPIWVTRLATSRIEISTVEAGSREESTDSRSNTQLAMRLCRQRTPPRASRPHLMRVNSTCSLYEHKSI